MLQYFSSFGLTDRHRATDATLRIVEKKFGTVKDISNACLSLCELGIRQCFFVEFSIFKANTS